MLDMNMAGKPGAPITAPAATAPLRSHLVRDFQ